MRWRSACWRATKKSSATCWRATKKSSAACSRAMKEMVRRLLARHENMTR